MALTKTRALYFISVKTEQQRVGEYLNPNFAGYLNFKRDEPELELHIQKSKALKGKIATKKRVSLHCYSSCRAGEEVEEWKAVWNINC